MRPILIVLGKNWQHGRLSAESRLNVLAAAEILRSAPHLIVLSGGHTAGKDHPSEAAVMADYLRHRVNAPELLLEDDSIDTAGNATYCCALLGTPPISLVTTASHGPASAHLFARAGFPITATYCAEQVVAGRSPHHARWIDRYRRSPRARLMAITEALRRIVLRIDPSGLLLRPLVKLTRR
ncbi:MAG TPA: YdcF family protein [Chloroflexota bacterium]|nr:YdcF family protein [Chloroflexota bacterium]